MSEQVTKPLTTAENIFKSLVWDPIIATGEAALFLEIPALDAPIVGTIDRAIISQASNWLFYQLRLFTDITAIKLLNHEHQAAFDSASVSLAVIAHDKGIDSDDFKNAREKAKADMSKYTQFAR